MRTKPGRIYVKGWITLTRNNTEDLYVGVTVMVCNHKEEWGMETDCELASIDEVLDGSDRGVELTAAEEDAVRGAVLAGDWEAKEALE